VNRRDVPKKGIVEEESSLGKSLMSSTFLKKKRSSAITNNLDLEEDNKSHGSSRSKNTMKTLMRTSGTSLKKPGLGGSKMEVL